MSYLALHLRNQADAMYESAYPERVAKLYIAANRIEADEKTIERLTRELDETRAEVTRLNALINTPQPVITGIWRRSVI